MRHRGFTLVELLVVIAIIGLLSTVAVISLNQARLKSRDAKRMADIRQIITALTLYREDNGHYPDPTALTCNPGASGGWYCLGHGNAGTCWAAGDTYHGCTLLDNALSPYIGKIPDDPLNDTAHYGDAYLYNYNAPAGWSGLPRSGTALHWGYETMATTDMCFGGLTGAWNAGGKNNWWCATLLDQ